MKTYLEALALSIVAVFAPIKAVMLVTLTLVMCDFITGVWASRKQGKPITSSGFKRTVGKILIYETALCMAFLVHQYLTGDLIPADKLIASLIGLVELKSCLENFDIITGQDTFKAILDRILQAQKDSEPKP
jgi:phage-related holin